MGGRTRRQPEASDKPRAAVRLAYGGIGYGLAGREISALESCTSRAGGLAFILLAPNVPTVPPSAQKQR
jgi:hypothetical protein